MNSAKGAHSISLAGDVDTTRRVIAAQNGPVILVGHSYGGAVITEAGNDPKVIGLVYIAAFAPDRGESVSTPIQNPPPGAPVPPILPPQDGYLLLDRDKFAASFAADVDPELAAFMADAQVPWGVDALGGTVREPAWRSKPSWYLVATDDRMIPPPAQRFMSSRAGATVVEEAGSHAIYVSKPAVVARLIATAAKESRALAYSGKPRNHRLGGRAFPSFPPSRGEAVPDTRHHQSSCAPVIARERSARSNPSATYLRVSSRIRYDCWALTGSASTRVSPTRLAARQLMIHLRESGGTRPALI